MFGLGHGDVALAHRRDHPATVAIDSRDGYSGQVDLAPDAVFDEVSDASVELGEELVESVEDPRVDLQTGWDGLEPTDGAGAFCGGETAVPDAPSDVAQLLLEGDVGLLASRPLLLEGRLNRLRKFRQPSGEEPLGIDHEAEAHHAREGLHADDQVVLGLENADQSRLGRALDEGGRRSPPAQVDGVVRGVEAGVQRACQCAPAQPVGAAQLLPAGNTRVPLVQHDQCPDDGRNVANDRLALLRIEPSVAEPGVEVMLAQRSRSRELAPVLDQRHVVRCRQFLERRQGGCRGADAVVQGVLERCERPVIRARRAERVGRRPRRQSAGRARCHGGRRLVGPDQGRLAVATDLLADLLPFLRGGGDRDGVAAAAANALLDPVLAQQFAELGSEQAAGLAVHQDSSSAWASSSMARTSSICSGSTP